MDGWRSLAAKARGRCCESLSDTLHHCSIHMHDYVGSVKMHNQHGLSFSSVSRTSFVLYQTVEYV